MVGDAIDGGVFASSCEFIFGLSLLVIIHTSIFFISLRGWLEGLLLGMGKGKNRIGWN